MANIGCKYKLKLLILGDLCYYITILALWHS